MKKQEKEFELFKFETNIPEVTKNESGQLTGGFIDIATIVRCDGDSNGDCNQNCSGNCSCNPKCPPVLVNFDCKCTIHTNYCE